MLVRKSSENLKLDQLTFISSGTTSCEAMIISWSVSLSNANECLPLSPALEDTLNACICYSVAALFVQHIIRNTTQAILS